jgi:alcohol/geraniol dehydrogenase (NADP+)
MIGQLFKMFENLFTLSYLSIVAPSRAQSAPRDAPFAPRTPRPRATYYFQPHRRPTMRTADIIDATEAKRLLLGGGTRFLCASSDAALGDAVERARDGASDGSDANGSSAKDAFDDARVPGAVFYDHDAVCDLSSPLPRAFPTRTTFARTCGAVLGVRASDDVVIYARDAKDYAAHYAAHVFVEYAHRGRVCVLEGGFEGWVASGGELELGTENVREYASVKYDDGESMRGGHDDDVKSGIIDAMDALVNLSTQRLQILDCRRREVFEGMARDSTRLRIQGRVISFDGFREGHIPGAKNVPYDALFDVRNGDLEKVFVDAGLDLSMPVAVVGTGGVDASPMVAFALRRAGCTALVVRNGMAAWCTAQGGSYPMSVANSSPHASHNEKRLIVWAVTRSRSTALERSVSIHSEGMVMHELLTEPYLKENNQPNYKKIVDGQHENNVASSGCSYATMLEVMTADYSAQGRPFFFTKELTCYFDLAQIQSSWLHRFTHVVLIRDPLAALQSFYRVAIEGAESSSYFDPNEAGFVEAFGIVNALKRINAKVLVIDADKDVVENSEKTMKAICAHASVKFEGSMMSWKAKELTTWEKFRGWHHDASKSTGFKAVEKPPIELPQLVYDEAKKNKPYYEACAWESKRIAEQWPILRQVAQSDLRFSVIVCASEDGANDMFSRLAAARMDNIAIYEFKPLELNEALSKCPYMFDEPVVLIGTRTATIYMAEALRDRQKSGKCAVLRVLCVDSVHHQVHPSGFKHTWVPEENLKDQSFMNEVLSTLANDMKTAQGESARAMEVMNATAASISDGEMHWRSGLLHKLQELPSNAPCVTDGSNSYTLRQVYSRALHVAKQLESFGAVNSRVGLFVLADASSVWAAMGSLLCESVFCEIPAWYRDNDLERVLRLNESKAIIVSRGLLEFVPEQFKKLVIVLEDIPVSPDISNEIHSALMRPDTPNAPGFSVLTSGTTGVSKILICPQSALTDSVGVIGPNMRGGDIMGSFWIYYYFFIPLLAGRTLSIIPNEFFLKPRDLVHYIKSQKMTMLYFSPSILESCLLHVPPEEFSEAMRDVHTILTTGERGRKETRVLLTERLPRTRWTNVYSTNETGDLALSEIDSFYLRQGTQMRVLNDAGEYVARGAVGQLHVKKSGLLNGYYTDSGHVAIDGDFYPTGDLVRWLGSNQITFESRQSSAYVKIRGFKVSPTMVQEVLLKLRGIKSAIISTVGESDIDQQLVAGVAFEAGMSLKEAELRAHMAAHTPRYMIPSAFYELDSKVTTASSGKVVKLKIDNLRRISDTEVSELTEKEEEVASVWRQVLAEPSKNFSPSQSFFDFGGSLKFVELAGALSKQWGVTVTVAEVIAKPTLKEMAILSTETEQAQFDPTAEAAKYDFSKFTKVTSKARSGKAKVLLTGATGYLGAYLLKELAENDSVETIYAVVRAKDESRAMQRVVDVYTKRGLEFSDNVKSKTVFVCGDMSQQAYGIPEAKLNEFLPNIDIVISGGAEVNMVKSYSALEEVNVGGTFNGLELAAKANAKHVLISTQLPLPGETPTGYRRSKEVAELLCARAQTEVGIESAVLLFGDINISRTPGSLAPDDDYIVIFLRACLTTGFFPKTDWAVSILCIDDCVKMISSLSLDGALDRYAFDGVAREVKGKLIDFSKLCDWLSVEQPLTMCSYEGWMNVIKAGAAEGKEKLQRVLLTIDAMEVELKAEGEHFRSGAPDDTLYGVDDVWAQSLVSALIGETVDSVEIDERDMTVGYAALAQGEDLTPFKYKLPDMTPTSVEVKVEFCGLCGSDDHLIVGDYGEYAVWPQVCGHEVVGTVTAVGNAVSTLKPGQRVGVGWQSASCHDCEWCARGDEQLCSQVGCTCCEGNKGGFADRMRISDSAFCYKIPDGLASAEVAPLLCGGQTVWTPLSEQTKSSDRIGVLGLGGLGHMAIKFAKALGREVTAISSSPSKKQDALSHGASKFLVHTNDDEMAAAAQSLDFILVTIATNKEVDFSKFFPLLRPRGTICFVGMCPPITADVFTLGFTMNNITTSNTGGKKDMVNMLEFCARHNIGASVAVTPLSKINDAVTALRSGESHFRHVLSNDFGQVPLSSGFLNRSGA